MSDVLIRADGVSKKFCRSLTRSLWYGVRDSGADLVARRGGSLKLRKDEFWAVDDVSFEVRRGECLGLIGRNGAGKTTLLKMLNGLIKPDKGRIEMRGRVGALIALGAGFNPILTGRENVYVNGSVLGLSKKEIDRKFDEIVDFAEIAEFIDSPVQSYSSGMQVRLGFAVATALEPDVLLLDEVLAVGDAAFRAKCYNRIGDIQKQSAVIFVSHSMDQVARMCNSVQVLSKGCSKFLGSPEQGITVYENENKNPTAKGKSFTSVAGAVKSGSITLANETIRWGAPLSLLIEVECSEAVIEPKFYGIFYDQAGAMAASFFAEADTPLRFEPGPNRATVWLQNVPLAAGYYRLGLTVQSPGRATTLLWSYQEAGVHVHSSPNGFAATRLPASVRTGD